MTFFFFPFAAPRPGTLNRELQINKFVRNREKTPAVCTLLAGQADGIKLTKNCKKETRLSPNPKCHYSYLKDKLSRRIQLLQVFCDKNRPLCSRQVLETEKPMYSLLKHPEETPTAPRHERRKNMTKLNIP